MGWFEYLVRKSHPTYVVDQVGRARSGFNQAAINNRLSGTSTAPTGSVTPTAPGAPAAIGQGAFRFGDRGGVWTNFRFGPKFGEAFAGEQFPVEDVGELSKQAIPDLTSQVPQPNPTLKALSELAGDLHGAVLISHSQSGPFPMDGADRSARRRPDRRPRTGRLPRELHRRPDRQAGQDPHPGGVRRQSLSPDEAGRDDLAK